MEAHGAVARTLDLSELWQAPKACRVASWCKGGPRERDNGFHSTSVASLSSRLVTKGQW